MTIYSITNYIRSGAAQAADCTWNLIYGLNMERYQTLCTLADHPHFPRIGSAVALFMFQMAEHYDAKKITEREILPSEAIFRVILVTSATAVAFAVFTGIQQAAREALQRINGPQLAGNFGLQPFLNVERMNGG